MPVGRIMRRTLQRVHRDERGQVLIFFAMFIVSVGLAMGVVAVDASFWHSERRHVQVAADAAALAAAQEIPVSDPASGDETAIQNTGLRYAQFDGYDPSADPNVNVTVQWKPASYGGDPRYVEVTIDSPSAGFFIGAFRGVLAPHHGARAVAKVYERTACVVCILSSLNPSADKALEHQGDADIAVSGGSIAVNSKATNAMTIEDEGNIAASAIGAVGGWTSPGAGDYSPAPSLISPISDPLASVPVPSPGPRKGSATTGTLDPGVYDSITANGAIMMRKGIYVVTGGVSIPGNASISGSEVLIYFACRNYPTPCGRNERGAGLAISGSGDLSLTAPVGGPFQGLTLFYDRNNHQSLLVNGTGEITPAFSGTIYAKSAHLDVDGDGGIRSADTAIIVDTLHIAHESKAPIELDFAAALNAAQIPGATLVE